MASKPIVVTQADKDYIMSALDQARASAVRLSNRTGQLPFAVDGYRKEADKISAVKARVSEWEVAK